MRSTVTADPLDRVVSVTPAFPAASTWLAQENTVACSVSSPERVNAEVHDVPEPLIVVASPSMVHTKLVTDSDAVIESVIMSPVFASVVSSLFEAMVIVSVGFVASTTSGEDSVRVVKAVFVLPAASVSTMLIGVAPAALSLIHI